VRLQFIVYKSVFIFKTYTTIVVYSMVSTIPNDKKLPSGFEDFCLLGYNVLFPACFMLVSCLVYSSAPNMKAPCPLKCQLTFAGLHFITHISQKTTLYSTCSENIKFYILAIVHSVNTGMFQILFAPKFLYVFLIHNVCRMKDFS
jgi:hypothetical protein